MPHVFDCPISVYVDGTRVYPSKLCFVKREINIFVDDEFVVLADANKVGYGFRDIKHTFEGLWASKKSMFSVEQELVDSLWEEI